MKFSEWINQQDIELAHWEPVVKYDLWGNEDHEHELVPYEPDEVDVIIERYLRNIRKIYGDQPAAGNDCGHADCWSGDHRDNCLCPSSITASVLDF